MVGHRRTARALAAVAVAAGGLAVLPALPAQAVTTVFGSTCQGTEDAVAMVATLTADCQTPNPVPVPDGWTLEGAGHSVTAIDAGTARFTGPVIGQRVGGTTDSTMVVRNVVVHALFSGTGRTTVVGIGTGNARATISGVTIDGVGDTNTEGIGIAPYNATGTDFIGATTSGDVTVTSTVIRHVTSYGILQDGGNLVADRITVGRSTDPGTENPSSVGFTFYPPSGVVLDHTASGRITNSTIASTPAPAGVPRPGAGVQLHSAGSVVLDRVDVNGQDADTGVVVDDRDELTALRQSATQPVSPTRAAISCSTISRTTTPAAKASYGFGILHQNSTTGSSVSVDVGTQFSGWRANTSGPVTTTPGNCRATVAAPSATLYPSKTDVCPGKRFGLFGQATPAAPGTRVLLQRKVGRKWKTVARTTEDRGGNYHFTRRARRGSQTYRVVVGGVVTNRVTIRGRCGGTGSITSG